MHQYVKIGMIAVAAVIVVRTLAGFVPVVGPMVNAALDGNLLKKAA